METPDQETEEVWKERLKKKFVRYQHLMQHLKKSGRHWTMKEKFSRQRAYADKRNANNRHISQLMKQTDEKAFKTPKKSRAQSSWE